MGRQRDELDLAFRRVEALTAVAALIDALEQLRSADLFREEGLFAWPILRTRLPWFSRRIGATVAAALGGPIYLRFMQVRVLSAAVVLFGRAGRKGQGLLLTGLFATSVATHLRLGGSGLDGSDQMSLINFGATALDKAAGSDRRARVACLRFIAFQSVLSYATAGLVKLASPTWRDGTALVGIFRTSTYGDRQVYRLLHDHPLLARALAWGVILSETAFPAVLVLPRRAGRVMLLGAGLFHLLGARFMGLNRFLWSFTATHPAVEHTREAVRARIDASARPLLPSVQGREVAAGLVTAAGGAMVLVRRAVKAARSDTEAPGRLVEVGGDRVHAIWRGGNQGPTVVFENGLSCPLTEWLWVTAELPSSVPYVAYDRPGMAWTPGGRRGLTAKQHACRLEALLRALDLPQPYVLVGHSAGGLLVRSFAAQQPDLAAGLVLVEASHPDQFERSPVQREELPWLRQRMAINHLRAVFGVLDNPFRDSGLHALPEHAAAATLRQLSLPACWRASRQELRQCLGSWSTAARHAPPLLSTPVAVVSAGETVARDPLHDVLQRELAMISDVSRRDVVAAADHDSLVMHRDQIGAVVEAIYWTLARAST